jgi:hypothetical protein
VSPSHLLLFVCLAFLLHDDDKVLLTLLLELRHLGLGVLQLHRHRLHLRARLINFEQTVFQLVRRITQLLALLIQQPEGMRNACVRPGNCTDEALLDSDHNDAQ